MITPADRAARLAEVQRLKMARSAHAYAVRQRPEVAEMAIPANQHRRSLRHVGRPGFQPFVKLGHAATDTCLTIRKLTFPPGRRAGAER